MFSKLIKFQYVRKPVVTYCFAWLLMKKNLFSKLVKMLSADFFLNILHTITHLECIKDHMCDKKQRKRIPAWGQMYT